MGDALYTEAHVKLADTEEKTSFIHTTDAACAAEFGAKQPSLVFFRQFEEKVNVYTGAADKEALLAYIKPLMVPTVFSFTEDEIEAVFGQQQDTLILFRAETDNDSAFQKVFEESATTFKGKILFSYAGSANQIQGKLAEFMGVTEEDYPTIRALLPANMKKFQYEGDVKTVTVAQIGAFVDGVKDGSIKAHLKSAAVPKLKVTLLSLSELNSRKSLWTQPRMSSSNTTLHGAVIAKSSLQSGMSLVRPSRTNQTLSLPNSMLPSTRLRVLKSEDIQLLNGTQKVTKKEKATKVREILLDSKNSSRIPPKMKPPPVVPSTRNCEHGISYESINSEKF